MALRYRLNDRTRVVYGRPRKFDYTLDNKVFGGYIPITCDFKLASPLFYDDDESSIDVRTVATPSGNPWACAAADTQTCSTSSPRAISDS